MCAVQCSCLRCRGNHGAIPVRFAALHCPHLQKSSENSDSDKMNSSSSGKSEKYFKKNLKKNWQWSEGEGVDLVVSLANPVRLTVKQLTPSTQPEWNTDSETHRVGPTTHTPRRTNPPLPPHTRAPLTDILSPHHSGPTCHWLRVFTTLAREKSRGDASARHVSPIFAGMGGRVTCPHAIAASASDVGPPWWEEDEPVQA